MATKYQIFVSSTFEDLRSEREQIIKAILEMGHIPVGMEMFSAGDEEQWKLIQRQIDQTDYYVVVIAHRYGSLDGDISYTEKEYDYAVSKKIPVLAFVIDESSAWPPEFVDKEADSLSRLNAFKAKAKSRMVSFWSNKDDLYGQCSIALMKTMHANPRTGWVRANEIAGPEVMQEVTRLSAENARLRQILKDVETAEIETEQRHIQEAIDTLGRNARSAYVFLETADDWGDAIPTTLLQIFEVIAREALSEASLNTIRQALAFHFTGRNDFRRYHPVPNNLLKEWMADLASLELITPSDKRHSVSDNNEYWMVTGFGSRIAKDLRKFLLKRGLESAATPEDESEEQSS